MSGYARVERIEDDDETIARGRQRFRIDGRDPCLSGCLGARGGWPGAATERELDVAGGDKIGPGDVEYPDLELHTRTGKSDPQADWIGEEQSVLAEEDLFANAEHLGLLIILPAACSD